MVFVSLEDVVGTRGSLSARPTRSAASQTPVRVVVTPGSAAKCSSAASLPSASSSRRLRFWRSDSSSHFVCFVTDGVVRHKWVVVKRAAECAALRKQLLQISSACTASSSKKSVVTPCSCQAVRSLSRASPGKSSKDVGSQYGKARALEELLNALFGALLTSQADSGCSASTSALAALESFLDVEARRADAVDRLVRLASSSTEDDAALSRCESEDESPERPSSETSECSICCGELASGRTRRLPCDHEFHADCVSLWLRMQQTCPVCRVAARSIAA